jgi:putative hydrolase of the HAD superfamily
MSGGFMAIKIQAVTFDAYGTILHLHRPFERLRDQLQGIGLGVPVEVAKEAFAHEMAYYREHHLEGADHESLLMLRYRCVEVLFGHLAGKGYKVEVPADRKLEVLMNSVRFRPFDDVMPILNWCSSRGLATGVISNWDYSLPATLDEAFDGYRFNCILVSATEGMTKSDPGIYLKAARRLGLPPSSILHVGDEIDNDLDTPRKAGFNAILLDRDGRHRSAKGPSIKALTELPLTIENGSSQ